jgi:hypothetical protein
MQDSASDVGLESGKRLESDSRPIFCGLGLGLGLGLSGLGLGLGLEALDSKFDSVTRFPSHEFSVEQAILYCHNQLRHFVCFLDQSSDSTQTKEPL